MKKIQLHWQILIALILAIVYGILFPTSYMIRENSFKALLRSNTDPLIMVQLEELEGKKYDSRHEDSIHLEITK